MATGVTFCWGAAAGFAMAMLGFVLPFLAASEDGAPPAPPLMHNGRKPIAGTLLAFALAGGLVATMPDEVTRGQAIALGFVSQGVIKGLLATTRDMVRGASPLRL